MNQNKRLTVKEIAEQIGISVATVDRVLNNRGNVKPDTYQRVMEKIKELNYTPNKSASFLSRKTDLSIAIVFPELPDYFWGQVEKGVRSAYEELRDYGLNIQIFKSEKYDLENQKKTLVEIIESNSFDAIALSPNDSQDMVDVIDRGIDSGMTICTFNNDAPLSKRLFYIGCDYRIAGRLAADILCKLVGMKGKVGLITSELTFQMQQKITGFREVIADYEQIEMVGPLRLDQEQYNSFSSFEAYFNQVDGIYVSSAKLNVIAKYLEHANLTNKVALVGHDITEDIYQYLKRGTVSATICQDPQTQGYLTIKTLFDHLAYGEKINIRENNTKLELVTRENARYYM
ncbi:MAG: substrate-binding protein [Bacilli bacterium]|nr:substrate-binding protein [Bacilli bacterium]